MISQMLYELRDYLGFLKELHNLAITIHDRVGFIGSYNDIISKHAIHDNGYCLYIKSNRKMWDKCIACQGVVGRKCKGGAFFGMCYAGVEEYVVPVWHDNEVIAFISISGYRKDEVTAQKRLLRISNTYNISHDELDYYYKTALTNKIPDEKLIQNVTGVITRLLSVIYAEAKRHYGCNFKAMSERDYVYQHIIAYLEKNFSSNISLKDISNFCHYSPSYISHMFKERSGYTINQYVNNMRITEAKKLLSATNMTITQVSFELGFNNSNYFSNVFKGIVGISPKEYGPRKL